MPATHCPPAVACGQVSDGCGGTLLCGTCQLTAVVPPLAKAASTVVLEGTFHDPAVVHFSGGVTAIDMDGWQPHRGIEVFHRRPATT